LLWHSVLYSSKGMRTLSKMTETNIIKYRQKITYCFYTPLKGQNQLLFKHDWNIRLNSHLNFIFATLFLHPSPSQLHFAILLGTELPIFKHLASLRVGITRLDSPCFLSKMNDTSESTLTDTCNISKYEM
jgi:hypothetical protein